MLSLNASAYDINEQFSVGGVVAGAVQCQVLSGAPDASNTCKGGAPFQLEVSLRPTDADEVFFKLGFAAGNAFNEITPFVIPPWAAVLEEDVKDINGRNRDYLLAACINIHSVSLMIIASEQLSASLTAPVTWMKTPMPTMNTRNS